MCFVLSPGGRECQGLAQGFGGLQRDVRGPAGPPRATRCADVTISVSASPQGIDRDVDSDDLFAPTPPLPPVAVESLSDLPPTQPYDPDKCMARGASASDVETEPVAAVAAPIDPEGPSCGHTLCGGPWLDCVPHFPDEDQENT